MLTLFSSRMQVGLIIPNHSNILKYLFTPNHIFRGKMYYNKQYYYYTCEQNTAFKNELKDMQVVALGKHL